MKLQKYLSRYKSGVILMLFLLFSVQMNINACWWEDLEDFCEEYGIEYNEYENESDFLANCPDDDIVDDYYDAIWGITYTQDEDGNYYGYIDEVTITADAPTTPTMITSDVEVQWDDEEDDDPCSYIGADPCYCWGACISDDNPSIIPDPLNTKEADKVDCPESSSQNTNKTTLPYNSTSVNSQVSTYRAMAQTDDFERAFSITKNNSTGSYSYCCVKTGSPASYSVGFSVVNNDAANPIIGAVHTHPEGAYSAPSAGDIYGLNQAHGYNNNFNSLYVIAADGTQYVLTIEDPAKFSTFVTNYPAASNFDSSSGGFNGALRNGFDDIYKNLISQGFSDEDAFTFAMSGVLDKFDSGVKLLKNEVQVPNLGAFKEIHATPEFTGILIYKATECK